MLCAEGLSSLIKRAESGGLLHGCRVSRTRPSVSHILFVDDILFFLSSFRD